MKILSLAQKCTGQTAWSHLIYIFNLKPRFKDVICNPLKVKIFSVAAALTVFARTPSEVGAPARLHLKGVNNIFQIIYGSRSSWTLGLSLHYACMEPFCVVFLTF